MLPPRFLRHAPLLLVDSPAQESLEQIYGTFNSALLKLHPPLRGHLEGLTNAMIEFYHINQVTPTILGCLAPAAPGSRDMDGDLPDAIPCCSR